MPKGPAFSEDEKTTLESGWEEEASTTVEQGEVAEKVRSLQNEAARRNGMTNITSTGNSVVDEPTVDDQRANAVIAMITPPSLAVARLVVTQGNDLGQHLEISPGKSYTIGRAIDNDFVLTDIAVSRKHFDLRPEGSSWLLADRGSGNGTLVNSNIEDQPFALANGDLIEIGNTVFRFEQANAPPRPAQPPRPIAGRYDIAADEEEPSTVAGKPIRSDEIATPVQVAPPPRLRPKTAPPPAPLPRLRSGAPPTAPPPVYAAGSRPLAPAGSGLPGMPPHLARAALASEPPRPRSPSQSPPPQMQPMPQMQPSQPSMRPPQPMPMPQMQPQPPSMRPPQPQPMQQMQPQPPSMRPPQPQPMQQMQQMQPPARPMGQMAQMAQMSPMGQMGPMAPMGPMGQMGAQAPTMLAGDPMQARPSGIPTTIPGQGLPAGPSHPNVPYGYPSAADMQKHGQMLVVGNGTPRDATSTALVQPTPFGMMPVVSAPTYTAAPTISRKTKLLLAGAGLTLLAAIATIAIMKGAESKGTEAPVRGGSDDESESGTNDPQQPSLTEPDIDKSDTGKPDTGKPDTGKPDTGKPDKSGPTRITQAPEPPKPEPPKPVPTEELDVAPKPEPTRPPEPIRREPRPTQPTRPPPRPQPTRPPPRPQVAVTAKADTSGARNRASALYRQRKFSEAASVLSQAASTSSGSEATDLKTQSSVYQQLGVAYNRGMSPGAKPIEAYNDLRRAMNLDSGSAGGEFTSEIKGKLAQIAPKAAMSFYVRKDYSQASAAVRTAEANGISNGDTKLVRDKLEQAAKDLYDQAAKEINTSPDSAKQKLRQIKGMVDGKSPTLQKANQLLGAS